MPAEDVFIYVSYAHDDDLPTGGLPGEVGFVTFLIKMLELKLRELGAVHAKIWNHRKRIIDSDRVIDEELGKAALLIVVMSQNWIRRPYCQKELETFCDFREKAGASNVVRDHIVVAGKDPVDRLMRPLDLQGPGEGFLFYALDDTDKVGDAKPFYVRGEANDRFFGVRDELALSLQRRVDRFVPAAGIRVEMPFPTANEARPLPLSIDALADAARTYRHVGAISASDLSIPADLPIKSEAGFNLPGLSDLVRPGGGFRQVDFRVGSHTQFRSRGLAALGVSAVAAGAALAYVFRNEIAAALGSLVGALFHGATPPLPAAQGAMEVVDAIAFAPPHVAWGESFLVQVFLGRAEIDEEPVGVAALASDPSAGRRAISTLDVELAIGDRIDIQLEAPGLTVADADQALIWRGKPRSCAFLLTVPKDFGVDRAAIQVRLHRQAVPVGRVAFSMPIVTATPSEPPAPVG